MGREVKPPHLSLWLGHSLAGWVGRLRWKLCRERAASCQQLFFFFFSFSSLTFPCLSGLVFFTPLFPPLSHFLPFYSFPSTFLRTHSRPTHPSEGNGKKKLINISPGFSLVFSVTCEMLFKRNAWSIFPFHLEDLSHLPSSVSFPIFNMDSSLPMSFHLTSCSH